MRHSKVLLFMFFVVLFVTPIFGQTFTSYKVEQRQIFSKEYAIIEEVAVHLTIINELVIDENEKTSAAKEICSLYINNNIFTDVLIKYALKGEDFITIYNNIMVIYESPFFANYKE